MPEKATPGYTMGLGGGGKNSVPSLIMKVPWCPHQDVCSAEAAVLVCRMEAWLRFLLRMLPGHDESVACSVECC